MRGQKNLNFPRFHDVTAKLRGLGHVVLNPAENFKGEVNVPFARCMAVDLAQVCEVDGIVMLPGWEESRGARLELQTALTLDKRTMLWSDELCQPVDWAPNENALEEAQRLVHGGRNADYGHPADNDGRIAAMLRALFGWDVKAQDVWMIMVVTKLSRERNRPKRDNRVDVAGYAEVGDWIHRDGRAE
jgi:hypothetical protein